MGTIIAHHIGGKRTGGEKGAGGRTAATFNPATGERIGTVALATSADVRAAVDAAVAAAPGWAATTPVRRAQVLHRFLRIMEDRLDDLAALITAEHGKVLSDARGEIQRGMDVVAFAAGAPQLLKSDMSEAVGNGIDSHALRQPLGVVAGITPFNFPAMVPLWMFPIALACGNAFLLKPSERTPSPALLLADWLKDAGLPDGVFNVVQGDKDAVNAIVQNPDIEAISFVGSTPVARHIYETATAVGKRCQALGGAKNHMIIMPDADLDQAADALMGAAYGSAGERCMAVSVAVPVGEAVADGLLARLKSRIKALKVGPGSDVASDMGPLVTAQHRDTVVNYINTGVSEGATLLSDGRDVCVPGYENGYFVGPTLFDKVTTDMTLYREEIFGPVLSVVRASSYEEALQWTNAHQFGNGAALFTRDGGTARDFTSRVKVGMVGVNVPIPVPVACHAFGGWKASLFGDHHMHGPEGVRFYTRLKTVTTRWPTGLRAGADFAMPTMG